MPTFFLLAIITYFLVNNRKNVDQFVAWQPPARAKPFLPLIVQAENKHGLPPTILARIADIESAYRDDIITGKVKSNAGALGIMQIVPKWHPTVNPLDVPEAIDYAAGYLVENYQRFGSWPKAVAAYNWGPGNVKRYLASNSQITMPKETVNYLVRIFGNAKL